jgi:iron(III) transport system ATP-binding protein
VNTVNGQPAIALDGVVCAYPGAAAPALRGISLHVREGEFFSILGPSGSGKTTALRVMAGFERPGAGTVSLAGRVVSGPGLHLPPDKRNIGIVFQDYALFPHLTVGQNIAFGLRSVPPAQRAAAVEPLLRMAGLEGLAARYPHELSGGQQQRVAVVRALAPDPVAVLLDEPFSNLDRQLRGALRRDVRSLIARSGATAVLVTHDREEALALADRVAVLAEGRVEQVDTPQRLFEQPVSALVAQMAGPCELLPGTYRAGAVETLAGTFPAEWPGGALMDGDPVQALIRSYELAVEPVAAEGAPVTSAQVLYAEFGGAVVDYDLRFGSGHELRLRQSSDLHLEAGQTVRLRLKAGRTLRVFPASPAAGD